MALVAFKGKISNGLQFYFKPKYDVNNELYYLVENYEGRLKSFKMIQRKGGGGEESKWQISPDSNLPDEIRALELDFNDAIECEH